MILYRESKNGTRQWRAYIENSKLYTETGYVNGKLSVSCGTIITNEKTLDLLYKKHIKKGWNESILPKDIPDREAPKTYEKVNEKQIKYPVIIQPKLDGVYAKFYKNTLYTRQNIKLPKFPLINNDLTKLSALISIYIDDFCIEGELYTEISRVYTEKEFLSLESSNSNMSKSIKNHTEIISETGENSYRLIIPSFDYVSGIARTKEDYFGDDIKLHIFNLISSKHNILDKYMLLQYLLDKYKFNHICLVPIDIMYNRDEMFVKHDILNRTNEGSVIRNICLPNLTLKLKDRYDSEYQVIYYTQGEGKSYGCVVWLCIAEPISNPNIDDYEELGNYVKSLKNTFKLTPAGTEEMRKKMYVTAHTYLFKFITVVYADKTKNNIPRFATTRFGNESDFRMD